MRRLTDVRQPRLIHMRLFAAASKTPWPISDQARRAIDALRTNHARRLLPNLTPLSDR